MAETRTIRTVLELNAQRFNRGAASAAASAKTLSGELAAISDPNGKLSAEYDQMGNSLLGIGAAAATGLGLASKAAMDWESAWAGVLKTVDGSPEELAALEEGLRGLTKELPATHAEIAGVAEAAGQLGVAQEDVVDFTRTMINLGETTNLSADEAATSIAQLTNVMGTSADDVDRLGSALVALGNDGASTERDIIMMAQRLAGAGALIGASEQEILGLSSALASVGISAEAGGGALSRVLQDMNTQVLEGGEQLELFAQTAGVSAEEFAAAWRESPTAALDLFMQGLNGVTESGGNAVGVLQDLGIRSTEETRALLSLAGAGDLLSESITTSTEAWEENLALTAEAAQRYETTEAQLQIARNGLVDAGIEIGAAVLPVLADVAEGVSDLAGWFAALPEPVQKSVTGLGALVGATGLAAGGMMKLIPAARDTVDAFKAIRQRAPGATSAIGKFGTAVGITAVALGGMSVLSDLGNSLTDFSIGANEAADMAMRTANAVDPLSVVFQGMGEDAYLASAGAEEMADTLDVLAHGGALSWTSDKLAGLTNFFGANISTMEDARVRLDEYGRGLAGLAETDLPAAQAAFENLWVNGFGGTEQAGLDLLDTMPALRDQLIGLANDAELPTDDLTLLKIASGELVPVMDEATGAVTGYNTAQGDAGDATSDTTGEVEEQVDALDELQDRLKTTSNLLLGTRGSELDFLDSIDAATDALDENGKVLDENGNLLNEMDEDARASRRALDGIAESTHAWIDALPDDATAEELDAVMERGREQFIKSAEDMGMSEEAAADLADQLGLMPDFVETEVRVETEQAKAEWDALWDELGYHPPEVPVDADTDPAEQSIDGLLHEKPDPIEVPVEAEGDVEVHADIEPAQWQVDMLMAAIELRDGAVTVNGETVGAEDALAEIMEEINTSDGTVTVNGRTVPAEEALLHAIEVINSSGGTVTIDGNNAPAKGETDEAKAHADGTTGTIDVDANTSGANSEIDNAARDRSSTIRVHTVFLGASTTGRAMSSRAGGGWLNEGLNAGGWVPGPYPGPGVDNILWPVKSGLAGGGLQMQPLAGTEYVVNGQSAQQWGPALEAINSGITPRQMTDLMGAARQPSGMAGREITVNSNGYNPHEVATLVISRLKHELHTSDIRSDYHM